MPKNSCVHPECSELQNVTAALCHESNDPVVDLASFDPSRPRFSTVCASQMPPGHGPRTSTFRRDPLTQDWFEVSVRFVSDPQVLTALNAAAAPSEPEPGPGRE
jgi:hypothetical protein